MSRRSSSLALAVFRRWSPEAKAHIRFWQIQGANALAVKVISSNKSCCLQVDLNTFPAVGKGIIQTSVPKKQQTLCGGQQRILLRVESMQT